VTGGIDYAGPAPAALSDQEIRGMAVGVAQATNPTRVWHGAEARKRYPGDQSWLTLVHAHHGRPLVRHDVAVRVVSAREVSKVMKYASSRGIPVTPFGGGSGVQGAANSTCGGILLDLGGMTKLRHIDRASLTCTVEAGKAVKLFEEDLNAIGLCFALDPVLADRASIGGCFATRGAGVLATKYGTMQDHVLSAEIVLANGDIVQMPPVPRHGAGPDLTQLFAGSEGTLGIITAVTVRLRPMPTQRRFLAIGFDDHAQGVEAGRRIMTEAARPAAMQLDDRAAATGANMVMMFDGMHPALIGAEAAIARQICEAEGGRLLDADIGAQWWDNRHAPGPVPQLPQIWATLDVVADYSHVVAVHDAVSSAVRAAVDPHWGMTVTTQIPHWFDWGASICPHISIPNGPDDLGQALEIHDALVRAATKAALAAGGVINAHHGVGMRLAPYLKDQLKPQGLNLMRAIKSALDPDHLLCRGKMDMGFGD
jgi:alkyldihydroxyacetonephosphate synthase